MSTKHKWYTYTQVSGFVLALLLILITQSGSLAAEPITLEWENLVPEKGKGVAFSVPAKGRTIGALQRKDFDGNDEEYKALINDLQAQRYNQPQGGSIRTDLDGKTVRIPGYITPIEIDGENVTEFLLVPYVGACIHVPSPPGNQIVYVSKVKGLNIEQIYEPVWITGKLRAKPLATIYADVGYRIDGGKVEPYKQ